MLDPQLLSYRKGSDYLQTRSRNPRRIPPNFALYCDWVFWDADTILRGEQQAPRTIFVRSERRMLEYFLTEVLHTLTQDFVLVTASHDLPMPLGFENKHGFDWKRIVACPQLRHWFTENLDLSHEKLSPLPLGLPYPDLPSWIEDAEHPAPLWDEDLLAWALARPAEKRAERIFGCWHFRDNHSSGTANERREAYQYFSARPLLFSWYEPGLPHRDYLETMRKYQFVLCPHGGGYDPNPKCWEALMVKTIPIIKRNLTSAALEHLPVVIVDDWSQVNESNLLRWQQRLGPLLDDPQLPYLMSNQYFFDRLGA